MLLRKVALLFLLTIVLTGCGRIREAREAMNEMSQYVDMARGMADQAGIFSDFDADSAPELTENSVRNYYVQIAKLQELYPDLEFENPAVAAMQAGMGGKNLRTIITRESDLDFEQYSGVSMQLLVLTTQAAMLDMSDEFLAAVDDGDLSDEQRAELHQQLSAQREALEQAKSEADSDELNARRAQLEMVMRVRQELEL